MSLVVISLIACIDPDAENARKPAPAVVDCVAEGEGEADCSFGLAYEHLSNGAASVGDTTTLLGVNEHRTRWTADVTMREDGQPSDWALLITFDVEAQTFEVSYPGDARVTAELVGADEDGEYRIHGEVEDQVGSGGGGDFDVACDLQDYFDRLEEGDASTEEDCDTYGIDPGIDEDAAGERFGCTECRAFDNAANTYPAFRRVVRSVGARPRLGATHLGTELLAQFYAHEEPARAEVVAILVTLASVLRFSFDAGAFHGEFGDQPSQEWRAADGAVLVLSDAGATE